MQIQVNTDSSIDGNEPLPSNVVNMVEATLSRFSDRITRVEVHLSDENSSKKGGNNDIRCMMEARVEHRQPVAVTDQAATVEQAVNGAAGKMSRLLDSTLGRMRTQKQRGSAAADAEMTEAEELDESETEA